MLAIPNTPCMPELSEQSPAFLNQAIPVQLFANSTHVSLSRATSNNIDSIANKNLQTSEQLMEVEIERINSSRLKREESKVEM